MDRTRWTFGSASQPQLSNLFILLLITNFHSFYFSWVKSNPSRPEVVCKENSCDVSPDAIHMSVLDYNELTLRSWVLYYNALTPSIAEYCITKSSWDTLHGWKCGKQGQMSKFCPDKKMQVRNLVGNLTNKGKKKLKKSTQGFSLRSVVYVMPLSKEQTCNLVTSPNQYVL